jgi:hypothetical protein
LIRVAATAAAFLGCSLLNDPIRRVLIDWLIDCVGSAWLLLIIAAVASGVQ